MTHPTPGDTTARGYGWNHQQQRTRTAAIVARGEATCWRCHKLIHPDEPWDLGHDDHDRTIYRGPEHRRCNRATSGRRQARTTDAPRQSRRW